MTTVTVVTIYEVPSESVDQVIQLQDDCEEFVAKQNGFINAKFLRSQTGKDKYNIVSISEWENKACFVAAFTRPELEELAARHPKFVYHRGFYDLIRSR